MKMLYFDLKKTTSENAMREEAEDYATPSRREIGEEDW